MEPSDITKYVDMAAKRKWWIIIPFLLTILAGLTFLLAIPKVYEAETLILVQAQKVPENFVRSIVTDTVGNRVRTITQQVTSRTNIERIILEHGLLGSSDVGMLLDQKVASVRKSIKLNVSPGARGIGARAFSISFRGKNPRKVMEVTNALASNFIMGNLKIRESQALGTSSFLSDELETMKKRLMEKEAELKQYQEKHMGGLPEQLTANLAILQRLQGQMDQLHNNLTDAENRKLLIQTGITERQRRRVPLMAASSPDGQGRSDVTLLKDQLSSLEAKYTKNHPDVIRLKKRIARLEEAEKSQSPSNSSGEERSMTRLSPGERRQLKEIGNQINRLKAEISKTKSQIKWYEGKVEETPKREQEMLSLKRDYNNQREMYHSVLNRKLEADIAVSMEKKQKGEQFRVIDPAKTPTFPVQPDVRQIFLLTLALGLGLGGGLAFLAETMDTSYKAPEEVVKNLQLPVLVSIPLRYTERELMRLKRKKILVVSSVALGFALSAAGIVLAIKGVDTTVNYTKDIFEKMFS